MQKLVWAMAALFATTSAITPAYASMRVNPMIIQMTPEGRNTQATVQITNVTDILLPVEVTVMKRTLVAEDEILLPADDDFVVFPAQFVLDPGATQTLRLQWVAGEVPQTSESYYVYATQVPVPLKEGQSGVVVNYQFGISVQMTPRGVEPKVVSEQIVAATGPEGERGYELTVRNTGSRYARMSEHALTLRNGSDTYSLNPEELKKSTGVGFMLPGEKRTFFIKQDALINENTVVELIRRDPQN